jgi:arylsulfatase B
MYLALQNTHIPLEVPHQFMDTNESEYILRRYYNGMTLFADEAIFNVTEALQAKGLFNNTIIIVSTDNGASYDNGNNYVCLQVDHFKRLFRSNISALII